MGAALLAEWDLQNLSKLAKWATVVREIERTMKHPRLGVKRPRKGWCMLVYLVGRSMELFEHRVSANIDGHSVNHPFPTRDVLYFLRYHCITNFQTCPPWVFFGALPRQHLPAASGSRRQFGGRVWPQLDLDHPVEIGRVFPRCLGKPASGLTGMNHRDGIWPTVGKVPMRTGAYSFENPYGISHHVASRFYYYNVTLLSGLSSFLFVQESSIIGHPPAFSVTRCR